MSNEFRYPGANSLGAAFLVSPAQVRAARGLVDWSQGELAKKSGVGNSTVRNFEAGRSTPIDNNLIAIRVALETAGVEFIAENGSGAGVRLRKARDYLLKPVDLSHEAWARSSWKKGIRTKAMTEIEARRRATGATIVLPETDPPMRPWEHPDLATCQESLSPVKIEYGYVVDEEGRPISAPPA